MYRKTTQFSVTKILNLGDLQSNFSISRSPISKPLSKSNSFNISRKTSSDSSKSTLQNTNPTISIIMRIIKNKIITIIIILKKIWIQKITLMIKSNHTKITMLLKIIKIKIIIQLLLLYCKSSNYKKMRLHKQHRNSSKRKLNWRLQWIQCKFFWWYFSFKTE